jgi:CDP-diacylglycerol--glycerol-3-phosphate 3-phosphatidyltransferase
MKFVPNVLTITRIVLTPVLLVLLFTDTLWAQGGALAVFVVAAISDYLDGRLARSLSARSRLGQFLDPLADKVLVLGTFIALAVLLPRIVPWWAVVLIALRDVAVTMLRSWLEAKGQSLRTIPMAKAKTTLQLVFLIGMLALLAARHLPGLIGEGAAWVLGSVIPFAVLVLVVVVTVLTGVWYFVNQERVPSSRFDG